ncbi:hypothetical protein TWF481_011534 [Arthrobotrys musiformis]|uniref:Uncharacterized protein n=1 Tax=Arthrobotrys musiformis TaxID=47236 RepID=A0AAV9W0Q1_9PEZI
MDEKVGLNGYSSLDQKVNRMETDLRKSIDEKKAETQNSTTEIKNSLIELQAQVGTIPGVMEVTQNNR